MHARRLGVVILIAMVIAIALVVFPDDRPQITSLNPSSSLGANKSLTTTTLPTTTTIPVGKLPQTKVFPNASDPAFIARMRDLVAAVAANRPGISEPAFFPVDAYIQVKAIAAPVTDWNLRLLANYNSDIGLVHGQFGQDATSATFLSVSVPSDATWVPLGAEMNKLSYWRVYGTVVYCTVGAATEHFVITSMISWRGEWYVVHLGRIR